MEDCMLDEPQSMYDGHDDGPDAPEELCGHCEQRLMAEAIIRADTKDYNVIASALSDALRTNYELRIENERLRRMLDTIEKTLTGIIKEPAKVQVLPKAS